MRAAFVIFVALASATPSPGQEPGSTPLDKLSSWLQATRPDGAPLISDEARAYFEGLPDHSKQLLIAAVATERLTSAEQLHQILSLELAVEPLELLMRDNCILCHTEPDLQSETTLFSIEPEQRGLPPLMNLAEFVNDVHFRKGLSCAGCHGGQPTDDVMSDEILERWPERDTRLKDRTWIPAFCARCHSDPEVMRTFAPALPTDQLAKYRTSLHGKRLLEEKDSNAAQCVSCHGAHGIREAKSPKSKVHPKQVPHTCGTCHADSALMSRYTLSDGSALPTDQLADYEKSVHGRALLERGDLGAPACNDCHGNHAAMPPEVASVSQVCRTCHARNGELFDGSKHKEAFERHDWPECETCHGNHAIAKTSDEMVGATPGTVCHDCHQRFAAANATCDRVAAYFRTSLTELAASSGRLEQSIQPLAERGLDVEKLSEALGQLTDTVKHLRSQIHAFDQSKFDRVAEEGRAAWQESQRLTASLEEEYDFRQKGLIVSIGIMAFLALVVWLKLRRLEGTHRSSR
ncbi:MAG: hypothetical protein AB1486_03465 [Planctomycetota bacterium]